MAGVEKVRMYSAKLLLRSSKIKAFCGNNVNKYIGLSPFSETMSFYGIKKVSVDAISKAVLDRKDLADVFKNNREKMDFFTNSETVYGKEGIYAYYFGGEGHTHQVIFLEARNAEQMDGIIGKVKISNKADQAELFLVRALVKAEDGRLKEALADIEEGIKLDPTNYRAYFLRAGVKGEMGDMGGAIRDFNKCEEIDPSDPAAYGARSRLYNDNNETEKALRDVNKEIEMLTKRNESDMESVMFRGSLYARLRRYEEALKDFDLIVKNIPEDFYGYLGRAEMKMGLLRLPEALNDAEKAIVKAPANPNTHLVRAKVLRVMGIENYEEMLRSANRAITLGCEQEEVFFLRACGSLAKQDYRLLIEDADRLIAMNPLDAEYYALRGVANYCIKDIAKALIDLTKCLALDPKHVRAIKIKESILSRCFIIDDSIADIFRRPSNSRLN